MLICAMTDVRSEDATHSGCNAGALLAPDDAHSRLDGAILVKIEHKASLRLCDYAGNDDGRDGGWTGLEYGLGATCPLTFFLPLAFFYMFRSIRFILNFTKALYLLPTSLLPSFSSYFPLCHPARPTLLGFLHSIGSTYNSRPRFPCIPSSTSRPHRLQLRVLLLLRLPTSILSPVSTILFSLRHFASLISSSSSTNTGLSHIDHPPSTHQTSLTSTVPSSDHPL
ncbi:hypothetical protein K461DRAFT_176583 [Myriangium duriaei CBS 260.36]|uniref:Uncharacterized protein n=1 Tax=Myriangium duriaei CBS 260.36 TaxID=1168546 RepID=A0A9P4MES3_9PEZI|nr:hypothetical protein K461DRAFT_176583 [Myriangium duriaei CBS 260.36]